MNDIPIRDIHLPEMYGWWPPALGWWLLLLLIVFIMFGIPWILKRRRHHSIDQFAADQFLNIKTQFNKQPDKARLLQDLSVLLRRICMTYTPRQQVASLLAESWITQLDTLVGKRCFSSKTAELLITGPYQSQPDFDADELLQNCQQWIQALPHNDGQEK